MILGHESSGMYVWKQQVEQCIWLTYNDNSVTAVGSNVKNLKKGDRVALEPGQMCRHCEVCKHGMYELCQEMAFAAYVEGR